MFLVDGLLKGLSLLRATKIAASVLASYTLATVIYRLYFHPLSKYPGPFWAKISGFPAYWHTSKKDRHVWMYELQKQYGPTFRYTPNSLLVNTPSGYKQIFNHKANVGKAVYYKAYPRTLESLTTWNCVYKDIHSRKRRVLNNAFSDRAIRNAEPFVQSNMTRWCELIQEEIDRNGGEWSGSMNMADWVNNLIFDILGDLCFGQSFEMKEHDSQLRYVPELMAGFLGILHPIALSPFADLWVWLKPRGLNYLMAATAPPALAGWADFVSQCFNKRAEKEELMRQTPGAAGARKDFFHYLFGAVDPETGKPGYSMSELFGETEMLIIAGSDTTAISIAAAIFYLVRKPEIQAKLAAEILGKFSSTNEIKGGPKLQSECVYLQAFIKEVLRVAPPAPAEMSREVLEGGAVINGEYLPEGVHVSSAAYCMHHNTDVYDKPFEFRPERWIVGADGSTEESVARAESAYCPFSNGPRGCIGKNLAYLEMSVLLAILIWRFEMRQTKGNNLGGGSPDFIEGRRDVDQYQLGDIFVAVRDGPMVEMKSRVHV